MRSRPFILSSDDGVRSTRRVWLVSFLATLSLIAILAVAKSAQALTPLVPGGPGTAAGPWVEVEVEGDEEDEGEFDGAWTSAEDEGDEGAAETAEEEEEEEETLGAPEECLLSSADATVFASPGRDRLRFVLRYRTSSPTDVAFDYGLHGSKGSLYLGGEKRRFGSTGVVRLTEELGEAEMAKVMAARDFAVRLHVRGAPRYCQRFFDRQLTVRRAAPGGLAWSQAD